ncbi:MAG: hypothetical protein H0V17_29650 [Deltaproteobacteria bacterium]|nr:hypothetical protein [Deltaproteobacteria bacterium]
MNRLAVILLSLGVLTGTAYAQQGASAVVEGAGVKVGEGTVIHPIIGIETGVIQNVFYEQSDAEVAGVMRIIGQLAVGSLPAERMQMPDEQSPETQNFGDFAFRAEAYLQYDEYLSSNESIRAQRGLSAHLMGRGLVFPKNTWQFGFADEFSRTIRPVNFESADDTDRIVNALSLELRYRPKGRTLSGSLSYSNVIDYFEDDDQHFANRISHRAGLNVRYQWLPVTRLFGDVTLGYVGPFGQDSTRPTSYPLKAVVGIASAITIKTSINARVGFGKGFYSDTDFTNIIGGIQLGYRFSPELRFALMYDYDFHDSINANFYRDHALKFRSDYRRNKVTIFGGTEVRFRSYRQVIPEAMGSTADRDDLIFGIGAGAIFNFKDWIAATIDYTLAIDKTDFRYMAETGVLDDPSYVRQSVFAGVRAAY